jgi:hypothetical protein
VLCTANLAVCFEINTVHLNKVSEECRIFFNIEPFGVSSNTIYIYIYTHTHTYTYRVSQEECARLRESVPYVKVYRCNPKYLCPKLNGYGDNGQRKVWSSGGSTHCTYQLTSLIDVYPWVWCPMTESHCILVHCILVQLCSRLIPECAVSHVTSVRAIHVSCRVLGTLRINMTCLRVFL